jgi:hypothetical protein
LENILSKEEIGILRSGGIIGTDEIVIKIGDLFVAENVVSRARRVIEVKSSLDESRKRVLKG